MQTALVCIEFQNEFITEGGKLHDAVKGVMESTEMLSKSVALAEAVRAAGGKVMHVPIMFKEDASDNPNKKLGILAGCAEGKLFTEGTWNSEFCKEMTPKDGDVVVTGKKGLDAFPNTTLEAELRKMGQMLSNALEAQAHLEGRLLQMASSSAVPPDDPRSAAEAQVVELDEGLQ